VTLTPADADRNAREAIADALDLDPDTLGMEFKSRYCDPGGKWLPKFAASHVRTEVRPIDMDPSQIPNVETALARLPGTVETGSFPNPWVLRDIDEQVGC
jgi:hypothetical protein